MEKHSKRLERRKLLISLAYNLQNFSNFMPGFCFLGKNIVRNVKNLRSFKNSETSAQKIVAYVEYPEQGRFA
jgi:hypothetical protein